jgi:hypothetical protein
LELEKDVASRCLNNDCCDTCRKLIGIQRMSVSYIYIIAKLRALYSLILFGIRKNCLTSGTSLLLYQLQRRVIKLAEVIFM